jgi:predicted PolB exonuclease-like 3'-5' exonuclease
MLKRLEKKVWAFDVEWVPDPVSGRLAYNLDSSMPDEEVLQVMWNKGGATEEVPRPYLKTVLCRVVSVAVVMREKSDGGNIDLRIRSFPGPEDMNPSEGALIARFLKGVGNNKPQLIGFNSVQADLMILAQRSVVNGISLPEFCRRPDKPWLGVDYFGKGSDWNVDLKDALSSWGKTSTSLHEIASSCGIPGKIDVDGSNVVDLWRGGNIRKIVQYNECDSITTYLLWLRLAHFCGFFNREQFDREVRQMEDLLVKGAAEPGNDHMVTYLEKWRGMRALIGEQRAG